MHIQAIKEKACSGIPGYSPLSVETLNEHTAILGVLQNECTFHNQLISGGFKNNKNQLCSKTHHFGIHLLKMGRCLPGTRTILSKVHQLTKPQYQQHISSTALHTSTVALTTLIVQRRCTSFVKRMKNL